MRTETELSLIARLRTVLLVSVVHDVEQTKIVVLTRVSLPSSQVKPCNVAEELEPTVLKLIQLLLEECRECML